MTNASELKDKLQYYRLRSGYTQKDLAVQLFVAPSTLSKWENGASPWSRATLTRYCEILEIHTKEAEELFVLAGLDTLPAPVEKQPSSPAAEPETAISIPEADGLSARETRLAPITGEIVGPADQVRSRWRKWGIAAIGLALVVLIAGGVWVRFFAPAPPCYIVLDRGWMQASALLERNQDGSVTITENNPDAEFGKIESAPIATNVDLCPMLHIDVGLTEPASSYTIQILDKDTETAVDVIKDEVFPGEHTINLAEEMGWQGEHEFTINVWISGEGTAMRFDRIDITRE